MERLQLFAASLSVAAEKVMSVVARCFLRSGCSQL